MAFFQCSFFFRVNDAGWSESFITQAEEHLAAGVLANNLFLKRLATLPPDVTAQAIRISLHGGARDSFTIPTPAPANVGTFNPDTGNATINMPEDALLCPLISTFTKKGRLFLRGVPDGQIKSGKYTPTPAYTAALEGAGNFFDTLKSGAWFMARRANPNGVPALYNYLPITGYSILRATTRRCGRPFGLRPGAKWHNRKKRLPPLVA